MSIEQTIPLNLLIPSKANVRRTNGAEGISELAASIAAHGLRQNLNVRQSPKGERFEVVARGGGSGAEAVGETGHHHRDAPVRCLLIEEGESAEKISLAENTLRCAMHADDQCEAFRSLIEDKGLLVEEVAARFGVTPAVVKQRLKLANVSPQLRALFCKGGMGLDHVMALALSDDHAAQEAAWDSLPEWNRNPDSIRAALTAESVAASDRLAEFVNVEAYVEAGGAIMRDQFDAGGEGYLTDRALVTKLVEERLEREAATIRAEGRKWVRYELVRDYSVMYERLPSGKRSAANRALAGVMLRITHDGELQVDLGLIEPEDAKAERRRQQGETAEATPARSGYSAALVADLTAHRTAALRIELTRSPAVALAFTVHRLACQLLLRGEDSCLAIRAESAALDRYVAVIEDSPTPSSIGRAG